MTKEEIMAKFNRISNDPRQAQLFVEEMANALEQMGNIDVSKLPQCPLFDGEDLPEEYAGKIIYDAAMDIVWYPSNFIQHSTIYYFGFIDDHTIYVYEFTYNSEEKEYSFNDGKQYNLANIPSEPVSPGTKLYKHYIQINTNTAWQTITIITTESRNLKTADIPSGQNVYIPLISGYLDKFGPGTNAVAGIIKQDLSLTSTSLFLYYWDSSSTAASKTFNREDIDSDTVTEL